MEYTDQNGLNEQEFLARYNPGDYPRPSVAADIVIFTVGNTPESNYRKLPEKELRVLLIRRDGHPFLGRWALPGGFVRPTETVGEAARRELKDETDVKTAYLEQLCTFSEPGRDPRTWVMSCAHMALLDSKDIRLKAGDDASDARWFKVHFCQDNISYRYRLELTNGDIRLCATLETDSGFRNVEPSILQNDGLAFDHAIILAYAIHRLRNKVEYTDLALNLMPERFTLTELQQVYEVILGEPLYKAAFRRKIKNLVCETGEYVENAGHRPSQLFRRNPEESR